jgi:predicted TIM-barrel fold metal-dependent hydrolase
MCLIVDSDSHVIEPDELWQRHLPQRFRARAPKRVLDADGYERLVLEGKLHRRGAHKAGEGPRRKHSRPGASEPRARLEDMDAEGIDVAVLFPTISLIGLPTVEDPDFATALCRSYNDWLAEMRSLAPARLWAAALVPLHQDVTAAVRELERAVEKLGARAVVVRPNPVLGRDLGDASFAPFWETAARLGVPVCLHEGASALVSAAGGDRFSNYMMRHLLSHPLEQMVACTTLILEGVLERHPDLRVAFMEAGAGWVPYLLARMDEHFRTMGHLVADRVKHKPSTYFNRQCFVACDADEETLPGTVSCLGDDRILFASDYPHFNGTFPGAVAPIKDRSDLGVESRAKILGTNALRLFRAQVDS